MTDKQFYKEMKKEINGLLANDPSLVITVPFLQRRFRLGYNRAFDYAGKLYWDDYKLKFNGEIPNKETDD